MAERDWERFPSIADARNRRRAMVLLFLLLPVVRECDKSRTSRCATRPRRVVQVPTSHRSHKSRALGGIMTVWRFGDVFLLKEEDEDAVVMVERVFALSRGVTT